MRGEQSRGGRPTRYAGSIEYAEALKLEPRYAAARENLTRAMRLRGRRLAQVLAASHGPEEPLKQRQKIVLSEGLAKIR